jgi:hypothetical protein
MVINLVLWSFPGVLLPLFFGLGKRSWASDLHPWPSWAVMPSPVVCLRLTAA